MASEKVIYVGTCDNLDLSGVPGGDKQPIRVFEYTGDDDACHVQIEFARAIENEDGEIEYEDSWGADSAMRFRDMQPAISDELRARLLGDRQIEA